MSIRVAVIYSGEPRSYDRVVNQHLQFLEGLEYHTYHSTWTKSTAEDREKIGIAPNPMHASLVDYECTERPDILQFEKKLLEAKKNHPIFMLGRIQYMTAMSYEPVNYSGRKYDYVVRLRYDFEYEGKLIDYLPLVKTEKDIVVTRKMGGKSSPINIWDGFALGRQDIMTWYFHFHRWIPFSLSHEGVASWKFQPEYVYGSYLRYIGANVVESDLQPNHVYWNDMDVSDHRTTRTVQYYRDLATQHPEFYTQRNGKLTIENDSPVVSDKYIIYELKKEGFNCNEIQ